jgi:polyhydroxybutyrate depolymerase
MSRVILTIPMLWMLLLVPACKDSTDEERIYRVQGTLTVDNRARTYMLNLPPDYHDDDTKNFSLVIALHGAGGSASQFETDYHFTEKADASNFIVVYPEGVARESVLALRTWNAGTCCDYAMANNIDDVKYIRELLDDLVRHYRINPARVYVTGMSNGGMMAYRLACELSDKVAAIAVVSGTMVMDEPCNPDNAVPILHIHSVLDTTVPYAGGTGLQGYHFAPVDSVLLVWKSINNCPASPDIPVNNDRYTLTVWNACAETSVVESYLTQDGGHAWPGGEKPGNWADISSTAIRANDVIWEFFQRYER